MARYRLLKKLAKGGMAEVFLAEAIGREGFKKKLVIKKIHAHLAEDETFVQMFLQEARLAAQLTHPNIAQVYDLGQFGEIPFISMEYVDGPNLRDVLTRRSRRGVLLPVEIAAKITALACEGLAYAHELSGDTGPLNVIHRDISPENIMVSASGAVKVVDFGIAKASNSSKLTQAGTVKGKLSYMSPEQVRGFPLDARSDIYSLTVVLYELLTGGQKPFRQTGMQDLMRAIAYEKHVPAREVRPDLPEALATIVEKGLAKEREVRYDSCRELATDLERFLVQKGAYIPGAAIAAAIRDVRGEASSTFPVVSPAPVESAEIEEVEAVTMSLDTSAKEPTPKPVDLAEQLFSDLPEAGQTTAVSPLLGPADQVEVAQAAEAHSAKTPVEVPAAMGTAVLAPVPLPAPVAGPVPPKPATASGPEPTGMSVQPERLDPSTPRRPRRFVAIGAAAGVVALSVAVVLALVGGNKQPEGQANPAPGERVEAPPPKTRPEQLIAAQPSRPEPAKAADVAPSPVVAVAAPAVANGALEVEVAPRCEVLIGTTSYGTAPVEIKDLAPGPYTVTLRERSLGITREETVEVKAGETTQLNTRLPLGRIAVRVKPYATVAVDGKKYGVTPIRPITLAEGTHVVELSYDGGAGGKAQKRTKSVRVRDGAEAMVLEVFEH